MRTLNRLEVIGNVGSIHTFDNCMKVSVATTRNWRNANGDREERTDWVPITIFDEKVRAWASENLKKGDLVFVEARVSQRSWGEGDDRQFTTDVVSTRIDKLA